MSRNGALPVMISCLRRVRASDAQNPEEDSLLFKTVHVIIDLLRDSGESPISYGYTIDELKEMGRNSVTKHLEYTFRAYDNEPNPPHELYAIRLRGALAIGLKLGFSDSDLAPYEDRIREIEGFVR